MKTHKEIGGDLFRRPCACNAPLSATLTLIRAARRASFLHLILCPPFPGSPLPRRLLWRSFSHSHDVVPHAQNSHSGMCLARQYNNRWNIHAKGKTTLTFSDGTKEPIRSWGHPTCARAETSAHLHGGRAPVPPCLHQYPRTHGEPRDRNTGRRRARESHTDRKLSGYRPTTPTTPTTTSTGF